jgi:hypothetical protein
MANASHTLEAQRYGEWVTYHFVPQSHGVSTKPSFGPWKTLPHEEARRLWRSLVRKGWTVQPEPQVDF